MLSRLGVFGKPDVGASRTAPLNQWIGVVDEEIRGTGAGLRVIGQDPKMNLDALTGCEAVPAVLILPRPEAEQFVVLEGLVEVADGKDRSDSLKGSHGDGAYLPIPLPRTS
ncbi:MAG: hypothetical protein ABSF89_01725 [Acidimicrobiales bacterium]